MAAALAKITQSRQKDRDEVQKSSSEAVIALELRYIAARGHPPGDGRSCSPRRVGGPAGGEIAPTC
jgi:hypothetical protein